MTHQGTKLKNPMQACLQEDFELGTRWHMRSKRHYQKNLSNLCKNKLQKSLQINMQMCYTRVSKNETLIITIKRGNRGENAYETDLYRSRP